MLKRPITFTDLDGNQTTEVFEFNLTKTELIELESDIDSGSGVQYTIQRIVETKDKKELITQFQRIIKLAYGQRSEDGKRFVKNDQLLLEFTQHPAYDSLFMELATNDDAAATFIKGVLPKDMQSSVNEEIVKKAQEEVAKTVTPGPVPTNVFPAPNS